MQDIRKTLIIAIVAGLLIFVALVLAGLFFFRTSNETPAPTSSTNNTAPTPSGSNTVTTGVPQQPSQKVLVPGTDGNPVEVISFLPSTINLSNAGDVYLAGEEVGEEDLYRVSFYVPRQSFSIILLQEPLQETRQQAEQFLMQKLGITQVDMCRLYYFVSTPSSINPVYGGITLGFSFCPGATQL